MPFGARDGRVLGIITQLGYTSVYWTIDSGDWREDATTQRVRDKVLGSIENGGIVVQHCNAPQSAEALPSILEGLKSKGAHRSYRLRALWGKPQRRRGSNSHRRAVRHCL